MDHAANTSQVWAITYTLLSLAIGLLAVKTLKLPQWVTPAICFNNTTSLPLLLIQALDATGILSTLVISDESTSDAIQRAKSYFLVCAIVGNSMTFALGPRLMDAENAPNDKDESRQDEDQDQTEEVGEETNGEEENAAASNEQTSLLPRTVMDAHDQASRTTLAHGQKHWDQHCLPRCGN